MKDEPMDVSDIVLAYLKEHGYDGLVDPDGECACDVTSLAPCDHLTEHCLAGWKVPCNCGQECDWHIVTTRPVCAQCGKPVEEERRCYAIPTCYACLPPPEPLTVIPVPERFKP
jgi:hypothetical protein